MACNICGANVSDRSTYTQCTACRASTRQVKTALLKAARWPAFTRLLAEQVGTVEPRSAKAVESVLQQLLNSVRNEARK